MATASLPHPMNRVGHSLLISAEPFSPAWDEDRAGDICSRLGLGDIVLFSDPPADLPARDRDVLQVANNAIPRITKKSRIAHPRIA